MNTVAVDPAPAELLRALRTEVVLGDFQLYRLGAVVGVHPARLGQMLRGRLPMSSEVASRLRRALENAGDKGK
jgi:hypothetical protein